MASFVSSVYILNGMFWCACMVPAAGMSAGGPGWIWADYLILISFGCFIVLEIWGLIITWECVKYFKMILGLDIFDLA